MKTNVAQASIDTYRTIAPLIASQEQLILSIAEHGKAYTRRELGVLAGIENSAAARAVNCLVKNGDLVECGVKVCSHKGRKIGAVSLALFV